MIELWSICCKILVLLKPNRVWKRVLISICVHVFFVCDFVSCHRVEHRFSLVVHDKLYITQNNVWKTSINEGRLFVCFVLFCLYLWDPLNQDASDHILCLFGKLSRRRGALAWFHGVWTYGVEVLEYWVISSLKIKLNRSWKFWRNWNVPLVLLERSWWAGFNGIYLVSFGFRMWEVLIFKWFLLLKIQINSKKPGFGRTNQLRMW